MIGDMDARDQRAAEWSALTAEVEGLRARVATLEGVITDAATYFQTCNLDPTHYMDLWSAYALLQKWADEIAARPDGAAR